MSAPLYKNAPNAFAPASELAQALMVHVSSNQGPIEKWPLSRLIAYILLVHHEFMRKMDPSVRDIASKAAMNYGKRFPWLPTVEMMTCTLLDGLVNHLNQEEELAFPGILQLEASGLGQDKAQAELLRMYIQSMQRQLQVTMDLLHSLRELTNDYSLNNETAMALKPLYTHLLTLEKDISNHVYLERDILFPRALALLEIDQRSR